MALLALYVLIAVAISLVALGFYKEDYWLIILGGFMMAILGLHVFINGIGELVDYTSRYTFGILLVFIGVYLGARAGFEAFKEGI